MRTSRLALVAVAALAVLSLPAVVNAQSEGGPPRVLEITKVVDGDGPVGGYVIEVVCQTDAGETTTTLTFDTAGPGVDETQIVNPANDIGSCTITETEDQGAQSVVYECFDSPPDHVCVDDQTVDIDPFNDFSQSGFTVTNVFEADVEPGPPVEPPIDTDGGVVTATPTYTG